MEWLCTNACDWSLADWCKINMQGACTLTFITSTVTKKGGITVNILQGHLTTDSGNGSSSGLLTEISVSLKVSKCIFFIFPGPHKSKSKSNQVISLIGRQTSRYKDKLGRQRGISPEIPAGTKITSLS